MTFPRNQRPEGGGTDDLIERAKLALANAGSDNPRAAAEAATWLEAAVEMDLNQQQLDEVHYLKCLCACLVGDYDAAYVLFRAANDVRDVPEDWRRLAIPIYMKRRPLSGYDVALVECNTAIRWAELDGLERDHEGILANLYGHKAFYHLQLRQFADAEASCKLAIELYPQYLGPLRIMASIALQRGRPDNAIQYLSESMARRVDGPHFWDYANRGKAFLDVQNASAAFADLKQALQLEPDSPTVLSNLGIAVDMMGRTSEAWALYSKALQYDFNWAPAHHNRGVLFFQLRDYDNALRAFNRAVHSEPDSALLHFNRGVCLFEMQMYGEALSDLMRAEALGHRSWELFYLTGMCRARLNEFSTGMNLLQKLVDDPFLPSRTLSMIWNNTGVMAHRMGDLRTAHQCFAKATLVDPLNSQAMENVDRIEETMSGQEFRATEESVVDISIGPLSGLLTSPSPSEFLTAVNVATSLASIGVALL